MGTVKNNKDLTYLMQICMHSVLGGWPSFDQILRQRTHIKNLSFGTKNVQYYCVLKNRILVRVKLSNVYVMI